MLIIPSNCTEIINFDNIINIKKEKGKDNKFYIFANTINGEKLFLGKTEEEKLAIDFMNEIKRNYVEECRRKNTKSTFYSETEDFEKFLIIYANNYCEEEYDEEE